MAHHKGPVPSHRHVDFVRKHFLQARQLFSAVRRQKRFPPVTGQRDAVDLGAAHSAVLPRAILRVHLVVLKARVNAQGLVLSRGEEVVAAPVAVSLEARAHGPHALPLPFAVVATQELPPRLEPLEDQGHQLGLVLVSDVQQSVSGVHHVKAPFLELRLQRIPHLERAGPFRCTSARRQLLVPLLGPVLGQPHRVGREVHPEHLGAVSVRKIKR
mmetsp:Transcript_50242/g.93405  ORF Transcript_50242/g.93405 Transcript_50242/m.93405 type:complete len:214 (+) Transcript_50242:236-877(+)